MEAWSDTPISQFRIKFFLDTNVLAYLVDKTYSGLLTTIDYLKNCVFCDLVSSNYVIFEFVGIRKREHYLRQVVSKCINAGGDLNMSSLLKYKDNFEASEAKFSDVQASIRASVEAELQKIVNDFGIAYDNNLLHNKLLSPTFDINLHTKVSKEDSLVLVSSLWPDELTKEPFIFLISNDEQFVKGYSEFNLDHIFNTYSLNKPIVEQIRAMHLNGIYHLNLTDTNDDGKLTDYLPSKLRELLIKKNEALYLGKTIPCGNGANFPMDVICFRLNANTPLEQNLFVTIIGKDLDFIYNTKVKIGIFWDQTPIHNYPYQNNEDRNISFRISDVDENNNSIPVPQNICNKLRETGNLVFINPDSFI